MSTEAKSFPPCDGSGSPALFEVPSPPAAQPPGVRGPARVLRPNRLQMRMEMSSLDALLAEDHQARAVWEYVEGLDLGCLYESIRSVEGHAGRDAIDPRILMTLWLYATLDGVGSARELARLCEDHVVYRWICGGVSVNYHTLSDFRTANVELQDRLLTQSAAVLMHEGLVTMNRVAQDGMRVRANAGSSSFRRGKTLERLEQEAQQQIKALRKELQDDPAAASKRQQAARQRACRERQERIARARKELGQMPQAKAAEQDSDKNDPKQGHKKEPKEPRASTTDADVRVMKMGDGGFRPAVNVQFATDTASQIITGVDVGNVGSDMGKMGPMIEQHKGRYGQAPEEMLVDGGFAARQDIDAASHAEPPITVYAPVKKSHKKDKNCYERQPGDTDAVFQWRQRMATPEAQKIYKDRAATAECVNALARNRGMQQFLVRGLEKIKAVVLWFALAHNLVRAALLRRQAAGAVA